MSYIRKLSVGPNYPDGAIHYQFQKPVIWNKEQKRKTHVISDIHERVCEKTGLTFFDIFIKNIPLNGELVSEVKWKSIPQGMYVYPEYAIDL